MSTPGETFRIPAAIARAYSLRGSSVVREFESYGNKNWLVDDGAGRRYVLRRQHLNADRKRIAFQLAFQQHLTDRGIPTPEVVRTASAQAFVTDDDGAAWILFTYIEGEEYDFERLAQVTEAARTLARMHLVTESFACDAPGPEDKAPLRECWIDPLSDLADLAEMLDDDADGGLSEISDWWQEILPAWPVDRFDALPSGWIHGDFHGRNLVFHGDQVAGLLDFDDVDRGPYVYDVAAGMVKFGRTSRGSVSLRGEFSRAFVDGYESARRLTADERAILPFMAATGYPPHPHHYRYRRDHYREDMRQFVRKEVAEMRTLRAEVRRIGSELFGEQFARP